MPWQYNAARNDGTETMAISMTLTVDFDSEDHAKEFFSKIADLFGQAKKAVREYVEETRPAPAVEQPTASVPIVQAKDMTVEQDAAISFPDDPRPTTAKRGPGRPKKAFATTSDVAKPLSDEPGLPLEDKPAAVKEVSLEEVREIGNAVIAMKTLGGSVVLETLKNFGAGRYPDLSAAQRREAAREWGEKLAAAKEAQKANTKQLVEDARAAVAA